MSTPLDDMFAGFELPGHTNRDLELILDHLATPPEERLRRVLEKSFDQGWDAHFDEHEKQRKNPKHPITNTNPWRKKS